jgi:hypothetical protein
MSTSSDNPDGNETSDNSSNARSPNGRFTRGNRGGPGRPSGLPNRKTRQLEALLEQDAEHLVAVLIRKARAGDATALRIAFDRLLPPRRSRPIEIELPPINGLADLTTAHNAVLSALNVGEISASEAQALTAVIDTQRKSLEATALEDKVRQLEARLEEFLRERSTKA